MKPSVTGAICLSLAASIWGSMYVVSKYVLDFVPPITLVCFRYMIAFAILYTLLKREQWKNKKHEKIQLKDWLLLGWIGFIGYFISIALQFMGTKWSDAHTGALITSATPAFMVLFAWIILKEALTARKILSLVLATIGVIFIVGYNPYLGTYFWGSIILVGAAITWALLSVYVKVASLRFSTLVITTYAIGFAVIFTIPWMVWELKTHPLVLESSSVILGILYLGIVATAGAFFLWNKGLELMDASIGSLFFFFQPVVGAFLGWFVLHEELNSNFFMGGFFILMGVLVVTIQPRRK
ncbi:DMT family transporter [Thermoflavimicrobium daqui]|uniref:EamA family transporter n=1 Tax=Thermoflavimicrobium daqui TaxID=2137476 RepID=A0A364K9J8_9BACL|nr:DMT family transporter [Thermoflavimicrobium daqui]RAL26965.1 EamA family transporter [Thermoflavimicrobium daqui]